MTGFLQCTNDIAEDCSRLPFNRTTLRTRCDVWRMVALAPRARIGLQCVSDTGIGDQGEGMAFEMTTSQDAAQNQGLSRLRAGQTALAEGRLERAIDALVEAESIFRQLDDNEHLADSRMGLAEAQRQHGAVDQAANSYAQAVTLYREADLPAREAGA